MGGFLHAASFGLFSLALLDGATEQDHLSKYRRAAAIVCACLAAFGDSGGLLIWPALLWSAWKGGLRRGWIAGIACVGTLFIAVYLWNLPSPLVSKSMDFSHVVRSFDYVIRFLGLPWSHVHALVWPARLIGLSIFCFGAFALVSVSFSVRVSTPKRLGVALILFSFLIAGAAALARVDAAVDREMPIRYGMFVVSNSFGATAVVARFSGAILARSVPTLISMGVTRYLLHLAWPANCCRAFRNRGSQSIQRCVVTLCCWRLDARHAPLRLSGP